MGGLIIPGMVINMNESKLTTIEQIEEFLSASADIEFKANAGGDCERYAHISAVLRRFDYPRCSRRERGVLLAYLRHTSGYSRAQITRLVVRWQENRLASAPLAKRPRAPAAPFPSKYTPADVALLVEMDRANEDVADLPSCICCSGPSPYTAMHVTSGCPSCQSPICTTCVKAWATKSNGLTSPKPVRYATPLECARRHGPMGAQDMCEWTPCIRVTWTV